jgi:hypothetical protein
MFDISLMRDVTVRSLDLNLLGLLDLLLRHASVTRAQRQPISVSPQ